MNKYILANIYELKGEKEKAMKIYRNILNKNSNNKYAEESLRRLATKKIDVSDLNKDMCNFFIKADSKDELNEFERWLIGD